jgi:HEAT repeat protein
MASSDPNSGRAPAVEPTGTASSAPGNDAESACADTVSPRALETVRKAAGVLAKAAKASRLYPPENELRRRFAEELFTVFQQAFAQVQPIRLQITRGHLRFNGAVVLSQDGRDELVPGRLYWDGLREISFEVGVTFEEMRSFLQTLCDAETSRESGQDDLATLLWSQEFPHIHHVALDDLLNAAEGFDFLQIPDEFLGGGRFDQVDLEMHHMADAGAIERIGVEFAEKLSSDIGEKEETTLFNVSAEEIQQLVDELRQEEEPERRRGDFLRIIKETLLLEDEEKGKADLVEVLRIAVQGNLTRGDVESAVDVLKILHDFRDSQPALSEEAYRPLCRALDLEAEEAVLDGLVKSLDAPSSASLAALPALMDATSGASIPFYVEILGRLATAAARRRLIGLLTSKGSDHVNLLQPYLHDSRWFLVRNVALILGEIGNVEAMDSLRTAMRHSDPRVRKEVAKAISMMGGNKARGLLTHALRDSDPTLRRWAARELGAVGSIGVPPLRQVIESKDFERRELAERVEVLEAIAYAGRQRVAGYLRGLLEQKVLWKAKQPEAVRAAICQALGIAGGDEARQVLESHLGDRALVVREAARVALDRLKSGPASPVKDQESAA